VGFGVQIAIFYAKGAILPQLLLDIKVSGFLVPSLYVQALLIVLLWTVAYVVDIAVLVVHTMLYKFGRITQQGSPTNEPSGFRVQPFLHSQISDAWSVRNLKTFSCKYS